jgi:ABC-type dipeptide/oligopeptide/nickel transport system permease subunit
MIAVLLIMVLALVLNIPLGYLRSRTRKFSARWFLYVHMSIPVIIVARVVSHTDFRFIPLFILAAVAGQYLGGKIELHL